MNPQRERLFFERAQAGDEHAVSRLLKCHRGLVYMVVNKWHLPGVEYEDKVAIGQGALWKAIMGFDVSRGFRFSTLATTCIANEMRKTLISQQALVRRANLEARSLEEPLGPDGDFTLADLLANRSPVEDAGASRAAERFADLLARVGPREREVLEARLGGASMAEVGAQLGISAQRVQRISARIAKRYQLAAAA